MTTLLYVLLGLFIYSLGWNITNRLYERFDPASDYPEYRYNEGYSRTFPRENHEMFIGLVCFFWPVTAVLWTLYFIFITIPKHSVLWVENKVDKVEEPPTNTHYRG